MSSEQPLPKQSEAQDGVRWMGAKESGRPISFFLQRRSPLFFSSSNLLQGTVPFFLLRCSWLLLWRLPANGGGGRCFHHACQPSDPAGRPSLAACIAVSTL